MTERLSRALAYVREGIACGMQVGAQVFVSVRGEVVADVAVGVARPGAEMTRDTLVPWLSGGKPLTAIAMARLWERRPFNIDAPVVGWIPEFGAGGKEQITLKHLLTHTSGMRVTDLRWAEESWTESLQRIYRSPMPEGVTPGERAAYDAQANWFVLGEVVRRTAATKGGTTESQTHGERQEEIPGGEPGGVFARVMAKELFAPLGMTDCWVGLPREQQEAYGDRLALLHESLPSLDAPRVAEWDTPERIAAISSGGGARGPIRQLGRFYEALLECLAAEHESGSDTSAHTSLSSHYLKASTMETLIARHRAEQFDETFRHKVDWGLGFLINSNRYGAETVPYGYGLHASPRTFGHGGMQTTTGFADPVHGLVVAAFFNGLPGEARHSKRVREFNTLVYEDLGLM